MPPKRNLIYDPNDKAPYPAFHSDTILKTRVTRSKSSAQPSTATTVLSTYYVPAPSTSNSNQADNCLTTGASSTNQAVTSLSLPSTSDSCDILLSNDNQLSLIATETTAKYGVMLDGINDLLESMKNGGTYEQKLETLKLMRDIHNSDTAKIVAQTGKLCAEKNTNYAQPSLPQQPANILISDPLYASSATEYRLTFKINQLEPDTEVIDPLDELYNATEHLDIQISDTYNTLDGHVICIQNRNMFIAAKSAIENHLVSKKRIPMTQYFTVTDQIMSAYSVKTESFKRDILTKYDLLSFNRGIYSLKTSETINFVQRYNRGWFNSTAEIENIEAFGINRNEPEAKVTLKLHVAHEAYRRFLGSLKTVIMLRHHKLNVYEQIRVKQCLRCCDFGHVAKTCPAPEARCRFCGIHDKVQEGGHHSKNCGKRSSPTCCNCIDQFGLNNSDHRTDHSATSFACPLLRNEQERLRKEAKQKAISSYTYN